MKGYLHDERWDVLRSILPLHQAITTVSISNGEQTSFWMDVWLGDDALVGYFPILFSHCNQNEVSVKVVMDSGLMQTLVPRLTNAASLQLQSLQSLLYNVDITDQPDKRLSQFVHGNGKLDTGTIYKLLKAQGEVHDEKAAFI